MFLLISVHERNIVTQPFKTHKEANDKMMEELKEAVGGEAFENEEGLDNEWGYDADSAWSDYKDNADWKIVALNECLGQIDG